jgi:hypothetical protein
MPTLQRSRLNLAETPPSFQSFLRPLTSIRKTRGLSKLATNKDTAPRASRTPSGKFSTLSAGNCPFPKACRWTCFEKAEGFFKDISRLLLPGYPPFTRPLSRKVVTSPQQFGWVRNCRVFPAFSCSNALSGFLLPRPTKPTHKNVFPCELTGRNRSSVLFGPALARGRDCFPFSKTPT